MSGEIFGIIMRRIAVAIPLMLLVSLLVFVVLRLIPADPIAMSVPPNATKADIEALRAVNHANIDGVIIGRALYDGRITPYEALSAAK